MLRMAKLLLVLSAFTSLPLLATPTLTHAASKEQVLWQKIIDTRYADLPGLDSGSIWETAHLMDPCFLAEAFRHEGDTLAPGRAKVIHAHGSVALVRFVALPSSPFTGILGEGAPFGLMRVSLAVPPAQDKIIPGLALKFFIDDQPSLNIMAMPSLDGQEDPNVFSLPYTTDVKKPSWSFKLWLLENRFASALSYADQPDGNPRSFSLEHFAQWSASGEPVQSPRAPFSLLLAATSELKALITPNCAGDFRSCLENKGEGIALFEVWAAHKSLEKPMLIGHLFAKTAFVASRFGDADLFFKHPPVHTWSESPDP